MIMLNKDYEKLGAKSIGLFSASDMYAIYKNSYESCCKAWGGEIKQGLTVDEMNAAVGMKNSVDAAVVSYNENIHKFTNGEMTAGEMYVEAGKNVHEQWCKDNFDKKYESRPEKQWQFSSSEKIGYEEFAVDLIPFVKPVMEQKGIMFNEREIRKEYGEEVEEYLEEYDIQEERDAFEVAYINDAVGREVITEKNMEAHLDAIAKAPGAADTEDERVKESSKAMSAYVKLKAYVDAKNDVNTIEADEANGPEV